MHNRRASTSISGWINGFIGVAIFLAARYPPPASPCRSSILFFLTFCRGAIAGGACAGPDLAFYASPRPQAGQWRSLALVAGGVVIGFPLLTALALQRVTSAHSIVFYWVIAASDGDFSR